MGSTFNLAKPGRTIHAGVILLNSTTELLDVAPIDLLSGVTKKAIAEIPPDMISDELRKQAVDIEVHWITETGAPAKLTAGATVQATDSFETCPTLDIVLMGASGAMKYSPNEAELGFVRKCYDECTHFLTICAGSQAPMVAGLLRDKEATAPLMMMNWYKHTAPETKWVSQRWHRDGKVWTSGALLNGLDLMRAFITEIWGGEGTLAELMLDECGVPRRDVDYKDGKLQSAMNFSGN